MKTALLMVAALAACGGGDGPIQSTETVETLGEACTLLGQAICDRVGECQLLAVLGLSSIAACDSQFVTGCCVTDGTCASRAQDPVAATASLNKCTRDLDRWDCSALAQALLPPTCLAPQ